MKRTIRSSVETWLTELYLTLCIDTPANHDEIVDFMSSDVEETADPIKWNTEDIAIALRRYLESKSKTN